jgi:hypothetical protein
MSEHKVFKLNNIYFPEIDDDFLFSYFISDFSNFFLTEIMEKKETISKLMNLLHDSKPSGSDPLDKSVFEFANAIGGLVTYVLIEISNLYAEDIEAAKIEELTNNIFKGLMWQNIFYQFRKLFRDSYENKKASDAKNKFEKLTRSLKNIYPTFYESLEANRIKYSKEWIKNDPRDSNIHENCNHEWRERYLFRYGKFDECIHCKFHRLK